VAAFESEPATIDAAVALLEAVCFQVLLRTSTSINIAGPPEAYDASFGTRPVTRELPVLKPGQEQTTATFIDTDDNDIFGYLDATGTAFEGFAANGFHERVLLAPGWVDPAADANGHGTGESANVFSVAPGIDFTMVKWNFVNSIAAFDTAILQQPTPDVISCSLGWDNELSLHPIDLLLAARVSAAVAQGTIVVFSAGNGHFGFPGQHPAVLSASGCHVGADGTRQASDYASGFASRIFPGRDVPDVAGLVGMQPRAGDAPEVFDTCAPR
jgi:Subtilase family